MDRSRACPCLNVRFTLLSAPADGGAGEASTSTASPPRVRVVTSAPQAEHSSLLLASHDADSGLTTLRCLNCGVAPLRYASRSAELPSDGQAMLSTACLVRPALVCGASDAPRTARPSSALGSTHTSRQHWALSPIPTSVSCGRSHHGCRLRRPCACPWPARRPTRHPTQTQHRPRIRSRRACPPPCAPIAPRRIARSRRCARRATTTPSARPRTLDCSRIAPVCGAASIRAAVVTCGRSRRRHRARCRRARFTSRRGAHRASTCRLARPSRSRLGSCTVRRRKDRRARRRWPWPDRARDAISRTLMSRRACASRHPRCRCGPSARRRRVRPSVAIARRPIQRQRPRASPSRRARRSSNAHRRRRASRAPGPSRRASLAASSSPTRPMPRRRRKSCPRSRRRIVRAHRD